MSSLEELLAFNDEVASLIRAGVPVDLGLSSPGRDLDGVSNQINAVVARRVQNGASLVDAVTQPDPLLPPIYQSVVGAGLRCGRLPEAMEALSRNTEPLLDVRQTIRSALVVPVIICMLAYVLFVGSCLFLWPMYDPLFEDMGSDGGAVRAVQILRDWLPVWVAIPPVLLAALLFHWIRPHFSRTMGPRGLPTLWRWLPGVSRVAADQDRASLSELLALLVEHDVPLHEALRLAAGANGDSKLNSAAGQMASAVQHGQPLTQDSDAARQLPPFLRWAVTSSTEADHLAPTLRLAAATYRHRAEQRAEWLRVVMPTLTCILLAGGVTLLYCLSVFGPFVQMIRDLS